MFVDDESWNHLDRNEVNGGLWRVVVVRNLPYEDARRNGKVRDCKLLYLLELISLSLDWSL
jgi:hypothetical protein